MIMDLREREFFIALANIKGIDFHAAKALIEKYGSAEAVFSTNTISLPNEEGEEQEINLFKKSSKEELLIFAKKEIDFIEKNLYDQAAMLETFTEFDTEDDEAEEAAKIETVKDNLSDCHDRLTSLCKGYGKGRILSER